MKLVVENLHIDPEGLKIKKDYEALVNIQGTLFIYDGENIFFEEPMFTVVELTDQLNKWLKNTNSTFVFNTMDDEVDNLLVFEKQNNGWKISSSWQKQEYSGMVTEQELIDACRLYIKTLKEQVGSVLNVDLEKICCL